MTSPRGLARQEFSAKTKAAALKRAMRDGVPHCEKCGVKIGPGNGPIFEHLTPAGLGGDNSLGNCGCWCSLCADIKTHTEDNPRMAKADRVFKAHHGIKRRKGPPMPGSKASGLKKRMDGTVVRR
jgi:5-methylcytosine-specific restriction enzyme A